MIQNRRALCNPGEAFVERAMCQARGASWLKHLYIVTTRDMGRAGGCCHFATGLVDCRPAAPRVQQQGPMSLPEVPAAPRSFAAVSSADTLPMKLWNTYWEDEDLVQEA